MGPLRCLLPVDALHWPHQLLFQPLNWTALRHRLTVGKGAATHMHISMVAQTQVFSQRLESFTFSDVIFVVQSMHIELLA